MRSLFFDYGELLFDYKFSKDIQAGAHSLALSELRKYNPALSLGDISAAHEQAIQLYLQNRKKALEEWPMYRIMAELLGNLGLNNDLAQTLGDLYKHNDHTYSPRQGIPELVRKLKEQGRSLNIISNLPHDSPLRELGEYRLRDSFDTITFSYEAGFRKPHPAIYNFALAKAGVSPSQALFFSHDVPEVEGARAVGIESYLVKTADEIKKVLQ